MSKSPWGNIGAWAEEAEREEAEEREAAASAAAQPQPSFPSLREAVSTTAKQKKKTKMTLQEFTLQQAQQSLYSGSNFNRGLTPEEMLRLPTGPRERSPDEMQYGRLGGGFSSYGTRPGAGGSNQARPRDYDGRRSYGFQDDGRRGERPPARVSDVNQPSRADEVDNWASVKKHAVPEYSSSQERPGGKYRSLGGPGITSRADEVDNWISVKKSISQPQQHSRSSSFGLGFPRPDSDRWTRNEQRLALNPPKSEGEATVKANRSNPFGGARPREEVLAEKGLDWKKLDLELDSKKQENSVSRSRPASSQSSRPGTPLSSQSSRSEVSAILTPGVGEGDTKQRPKVNPFGDAKPREVLLEQKGLDWKKIDLELEHLRVEREETKEEKNLKEELEQLKKELQQNSGDEQSTIHELILKKERELELLVQQFDDKVRYGQKHFPRQGTGAGRGATFDERPPSQRGAYEDPRAGYSERPRSRPGGYKDPRIGFGSVERPPSRGGAYEEPRSGFAERPPSYHGAYENHQPGSHDTSHSRPGGYEEPRAVVNSWTRPFDNRRTIQGGGQRGYLGSRDPDRSGSRW